MEHSDDIVYNAIPKDFKKFTNKLYIAELQDLYCGPHGVQPDKFPVVSRPVVNVYGMSIGAEIWHTKADINYKPGYFWVEQLHGEHFSYDLYIRKGEVLKHHSSKGIHDSLKTFSVWHVNTLSTLSLTQPIEDFIRKYFKDYTGYLNIETIADKVLEVHFRWTQEYLSWYLSGRSFYSIPVFNEQPIKLDVYDDGNVEVISTVHDEANEFLKIKRIGVINCYDLNKGQEHLKRLNLNR